MGILHLILIYGMKPNIGKKSFSAVILVKYRNLLGRISSNLAEYIENSDVRNTYGNIEDKILAFPKYDEI